MVSSPPASPDGAHQIRSQNMFTATSSDGMQKQRPQSMIGRPTRSQSRMSQSSNHIGSRSSDDDVRTSVKVGKLFLREIEQTRASTNEPCSGPSPTPIGTVRPWIRPHSTTISAVHGTSEHQHQSCRGFSSGTKDFYFRPSLRPGCHTECGMGLPTGQCRLIFARLQCLASCLWPVWVWQELYNGHIRPSGTI